ncbi:putative membrane protein [Oscillatoria acuminata PCC 6304]|uniref:Putative membrane protein n=2 Tax=Oscillatoria acuminata TaxID=118323 RepID=K9TFS4_9CYAN|nr:putative membrane protein [Oscillatoria acuminata PCC 6304]
MRIGLPNCFMYRKLLSAIKPFFKPLLAIALVVVLVLGSADAAFAARSGGRIGGGSFRAPSRPYSSPTRTYQPGGGGYYPGGGGFGFPFLLPFFGFGGGFGGLFSIFIVIALANFLMQAFRRAGSEETVENTSNPTVAIGQVQVGLLAEARELQAELDKLAMSANTGSAEGRAQVLQEVSLALLRHPEYWVYGATQSEKTRLAVAEAKFNQLALAERSKVQEETLSNVNNQLRDGNATKALPTDENGELVKTETEAPSEYIVVTLVVGTLGNLQLPTINGSDQMRQALGQIGGIGSEQLLAFEVLWTPQAKGDTLTTDDMLTYYPNLHLV